MLGVMLALTSHHSESYTAQLITFFISVVPVALLLVLMAIPIIWRIRRKRGRRVHPEAMRELLHK